MRIPPKNPAMAATTATRLAAWANFKLSSMKSKRLMRFASAENGLSLSMGRRPLRSSCAIKP
ncbi:hypothetical protein EBZ80_07915 [bacterium]|nr:hypothetical protein [bacterium]